MKNSLRLQRLVAGTMGFLFFGTHCVFAYSTESNIWSQRRKSREQHSSPTLLASLPVALSSPLSSSPWPSLQSGGVSLSPTVAHSVPKGFLKDHQELLSALSPAFGTIRKVSLCPQSNRSTPVVIHIQDVHQNLDAQKNIGRLVDSLLTTKQAGLIALEGTWGDIPLQPFRDFPHRQAVELSADYLLKENKISGPIHAILTGTGPLPSLIGVDDSTHYNANVEAYRQSAPLMETTKRILDQRKAALDLEKSRVFTPELKALDSAVEAYRSGQLGLGDYVNTLTNASPELMVPSSVYHFKKTLVMEKTMDFKQVERERADLIGHLVQKLNHQEMDDLTRQSVAYRSNQVSYGDFYSYLQALCHRTGVSLETYPAMQTYVRYVLLADGIQAETLLEDLTTLERNVFSTMAPTSEARALIEQSRVVHLARKLVDFSLTPEEWSEYLSLHGKTELATDLRSFEDFYREAEARDKAMAKNLIQAIGAAGNRVSAAILVTGGYHSPGLIAQLTQAGATVISVVPKIEKVETTEGISYLSVFTQEKTPLEELFVGKKLFLAQNPISQSTRQILAPTLMVLTTVLLGYAAGIVDLNTMYHSLGGLGTLSNLGSSVPGIVSLSLSVGGAFFVAKAMGDKKNGIGNLSLTPRSLWGNPLKGVISTLKKHMAPILLSLSMAQGTMASPSIPISFSTHSLENASQLTSFMMNYLPTELKSVVFFIGFYSSYGWVMAGIALLIGGIAFGYRRIHAALKEIESYRSAGNISKLLELWKENEWARERILIALRTLPLDKLSLHRGEVIVALLGTPGMNKKESIRVDQFIEILNVTPQEIGMHLLRGGLVGESSVYLNRATLDQLLVYKDKLISIVASEPTAQSVFAARILIQRLKMSPREVCIPLLENHRFYESQAQIDFVSPEEYQRLKREVQKEREIRQGFNRMNEKLGIQNLWDRIIAKDKSVLVDLILLLPKAKWTESRWEGEGPEGGDGWGFGTLHEVEYPVNVESDILEIIGWVGSATATEIPALCQLLNGSPEMVSHMAKKVLDEVKDTPENIAKAYSQVVKEHPEDSESSRFALHQMGDPDTVAVSSDPVGRATSRWVTRFFEEVGFLLGGEEGRVKAGRHYRDQASGYEWTMGVAGLFVNLGLSLFLSGSGLVGVVAPMLGAVFGILFFVSHFGVKTKTQVNVSIPKAAAMAVIYGTLIAAAPYVVIHLFQSFTFISGALFIGLGVGWGSALGIHWILDSKSNPIKLKTQQLTNIKRPLLILKSLLIGLVFAAFTTSAAPFSPSSIVNFPQESYAITAENLPIKVEVFPLSIAVSSDERSGNFETDILGFHFPEWISNLSLIILKSALYLVGFLGILGLILNEMTKRKITSMTMKGDSVGLLGLWKENPSERESIAISLTRLPDSNLKSIQWELGQVFLKSLEDPKISESCIVALCAAIKKSGAQDPYIGLSLLRSTRFFKLAENWLRRSSKEELVSSRDEILAIVVGNDDERSISVGNYLLEFFGFPDEKLGGIYLSKYLKQAIQNQGTNEGLGMRFLERARYHFNKVENRTSLFPFQGELVQIINSNDVEGATFAAEILSRNPGYPSVDLGMMFLRKSLFVEAGNYLKSVSKKDLFPYKEELHEMLRNGNRETALFVARILSEKFDYPSSQLGMLLLRNSQTSSARHFLDLADMKTLVIFQDELMDMLFRGALAQSCVAFDVLHTLIKNYDVNINDLINKRLKDGIRISKFLETYATVQNERAGNKLLLKLFALYSPSVDEENLRPNEDSSELLRVLQEIGRSATWAIPYLIVFSTKSVFTYYWERAAWYEEGEYIMDSTGGLQDTGVYHPEERRTVRVDLRDAVSKTFLAIGPATSSEIPALCNLLGSSSFFIRKKAKEFLSKVVDTPENISAAYGNVLTQFPEGSRAYEFAMLKLREVGMANEEPRPTGRATSRWMTRLFEGVGYWLGGEKGRAKAGRHYKDHAAGYEWNLGFAGMVVNFGVIFLLSGSGLVGVVAPLLGAVFGGLFFVSHFGKEPETPIKVSIPKAATMAIIYTALIIITPFPIFEFLEYRSFVSVLLLSVVGSWWGGALALHRHFDKKSSPSNSEKLIYSDLVIKSDIHFGLKNFLTHQYTLDIVNVVPDPKMGESSSGENSYRVFTRSGEIFVFRKIGETLSAARSFVSFQWHLRSEGKVNHSMIHHVPHYDENIPEDHFIILWNGVHWSLEHSGERESGQSVQGVESGHGVVSNMNMGRATSLWGVKLAEVLFGKRFGAERAGAVYKRLAPLVGTVSALATVAMVIGGVALLDGSAVAGVVAPLVGAVFGGIFMMSHSLLPNAWLPKSLSRKDIRFPNVLTMTILYATSITLSSWGIFNVETLGLTSQEIRAIALLSWPAALLAHGYFDGWFRPFMKFVNDLRSSPIWRSPLGKVFGLFLLLPPLLLVGEPSLGGSLVVGGTVSGAVGFLPLLFGSMIHQGGTPSSRAPFGQLTVVANVMDVGSYFHGNAVLYERSLPKIKKLLPEYAEMGATEIYLTNGLFTPSEMGKKVHTVPPASPIFVYAGKAISMLGGSYFTKRKWLNGTWFDDRHGSNFSTTDMRVLNPDAFDSPTNEGRWAELAGFVAGARRLGMKVKVDLVPWISPDGITKDNWTWAKYHQKVPEEDRSLSDEQILKKHPGNSLVKWEENGQSVRVLVGNFSPGVDQVDPDFNNPGYQDYLMDYLHSLIDAGVDSVRVDMAHRLGSLSPNNGWQVWTKVINDAKSYAKAKGQTFHFLMEAYPEGGPDWRGLFLARFPQEAVYHADPFHNYERIAKGEGEGLMHLKQAMEHARSHPGQWWAFPTNFDEWSLKNMGGPQEAFLALLLIYARLGVPLMVDSRELMGQAGQNIPQAGGQDRDKEGNFRHPFPNVIVRGFRAFWGIFRQSPHRRFLLDMKSFLAEAETIEILDTPNEHRYFAVGIKNRSGAYDVRVWDFYPQWGTPAAWVEAPKSFLSNESVALRWKETEKIRNRRLRNAFVMTDPSLPGGQAPLNLITVSLGPQKWHRFPIAFGPDHVARLTVRPVSSGRPHLLPRGKVRDPDMSVFPGSTFRLVMNTPLFGDGGESRIDFQRVENILTLDGNNIPFTSTALNKVRGTPPEIDTSNILALLPNGNLGMNDWFVGFANGTFYHKPREDWEHRTYDMLVQPVEGAPRVQTLRFRLVNGSWKAFDATTNKEETTAIAYAVFGQRIVKDGKNNVENLAEQFDDLRHLFRFPLFELPGNRQWHLGFNDDRGELYEDRQKVTAALKGQSVTLSLKPLHHSKISDVERDEVFAAWGYVRRQSETSPVNLRPGDYVVSADQKSLTVNLLPGIHPHSFIGFSQTGELMAGLVPGQTHHEGISVNELANRALVSGAKDLFLWANGKDAKIVGTAFTGEAEKARPGYLAAIAIERATSSRSSGSEISSSPTLEPQRVASRVLSELVQRPLNRGVGEFMDQAARVTVEKYSELVTEKSIFSTFPWVEEGQGTHVLFLDAESVRTAAQHDNLSALVAGRSNWAIITNSKDLSVAGIDPRFVFYRPEVFPDVKTEDGVPLGIQEVLLAKLGGIFRAITEAGNGAGLRFMHTSVIRLNPEGLTEEQNNIRDAADRAWLLNALFKLVLPARLLDWKGVFETLTAIAHNA